MKKYQVMYSYLEGRIGHIEVYAKNCKEARKTVYANRPFQMNRIIEIEEIAE